MRLFIRLFIPFILIVGLGYSANSSALDSLLSPNPSRYALIPHLLFKSIDPLMPDRPKHLLLSANNQKLYFIGRKGVYTVDLLNYGIDLKLNNLFASCSFCDFSPSYLLSQTFPNPFLNSKVVSDSSRAITLNSQNQLIFLQDVQKWFSYKKGSSEGNYWLSTRLSRVEISFDVSTQFTTSGYPMDSQMTYGQAPKVFPFEDFGNYNLQGHQINDFNIDNLFNGKDGFHYVTAINDQFENVITSNNNSLQIGGTTLLNKGTLEIPNIYRFNDGKYLDGTSYVGPSLNKPKTLLVGKGKCVFVDEFGQIYTIQSDRILKWRPNSNSSTFEIVAGGNGIGNGLNQLNLNTSMKKPLEIDQNGNMYICDYNNKRVIYLRKGTKIGEILFSESKNGLKNFYPTSIVLDNNNNIYISDDGNSQVYKFQNCEYFKKPILQKISNSELVTNIEVKSNWYLNNVYLANNNQTSLKPQKTGFYKVQNFDLKGCKSVISDSIFFECKPEKPLVQQSSKTELIVKVPEDKRLYTGFNYKINSNGEVYFINNSKNYNTIKWIFHDGTTSQNINPVFKYSKSGTYYVKLETRNLIGEIGFIEDYIKIFVPKYPIYDSKIVVQIPINNNENIWDDLSGFGNHGDFNGKINHLTNQGIWKPTIKFSSIKLPGCTNENINERVKISNSESLKNLKEITFSGFFALEKDISMNPNDGSCGKNGKQVLFSKGGDGFGTSPPGFNSLLEIRNNEVFLNVEFSKNSGDFSVSIPIKSFLDSVKTNELFENTFYKSSDILYQGNVVPLISEKSRIGPLEEPFQHIVISFSETTLRIFVNRKLVFNETREIKFDEINTQDLYVGAMGPKAKPINNISNWYPFKGKIDNIVVLNKLLNYDYQFDSLLFFYAE
jgi:hypothetical protein